MRYTDKIIDDSQPMDRTATPWWLGRADGVWYRNIRCPPDLRCTKCGSGVGPFYSLHAPHGAHGPVGAGWEERGGYWWTYCRDCLDRTPVDTPNWNRDRGIDPERIG